MSSPIVTLLAQRPEEELRKMLAAARGDRARADVEVQQIEEALAYKARRGSRTGKRTGKKAKPGSTRKRLLDVVGSQAEPISPAQIIAALREQGVTVTAGSIHNMIGRLRESGELARVGDGLYQLPSRNGDSALSGEGNGAADPLFAGTEPQEGASEVASPKP